MVGFNEIPTYWFDPDTFTIDCNTINWGQIPDLSLLTGHMHPLTNALGLIQACIYFPNISITVCVPSYVNWSDITTALEANKPN